ncbi:hypothetical protein Thermo_00074 [Thermoplasmatales archaeon]|nr:hypothetical protein Thermo_00074 [Thermoplasmatales archaeon]
MTEEEKDDIKMKRKQRILIINSIFGGVIFSAATLLGGYSFSRVNPIAISNSPNELEGIFALSVMIAIVSGYYLGISLKKNDSNAYLLSTYFIITMIVSLLIVLRNYYYFLAVPPLLTAGIGYIIWNGNIDLDGLSGASLNGISKLFLTVISASINSFTIKPFLDPYIGLGSYASYAWVVFVAAILIYKFLAYLDKNF